HHRLPARHARRGGCREGDDLHLVANRPRHPQQGGRRRDQGRDAERQQDVRADQAHYHSRRSVTSVYSPERRTAVVFAGTGAHGAYHAGVLRALEEAGVKIDLVAGHGVGAANAALVAPVLLVVATGIVVYPLGFLLETAGSGFGASLLAAYAGWLQTAFAGPRLPTFVPRLGMILVSALVVLVLAAAAGAARDAWTRRGRGAVWWWVFGAPFDAAPARRAFLTALWQLIRGAASV